MKNQMTQKEMDSLSALILLHSQKVSDYTKAVPNVGMAKRHNEWVEMLKKAQSVLREDPLTCECCIRERTERLDDKCLNCVRNVEVPDNFKRRAT